MLQAEGTASALQFDCQLNEGKRDLELYVSWSVPFPIPRAPGYDPPSERAKYEITGGKALVRHWTPGEYRANTKSYFAPPAVADDIIAAMGEGGGRLEVTIRERTFTFHTRGFLVAAGPVLRACGITG